MSFAIKAVSKGKPVIAQIPPSITDLVIGRKEPGGELIISAKTVKHPVVYLVQLQENGLPIWHLKSLTDSEVFVDDDRLLPNQETVCDITGKTILVERKKFELIANIAEPEI